MSILSPSVCCRVRSPSNTGSSRYLEGDAGREKEREMETQREKEKEKGDTGRERRRDRERKKETRGEKGEKGDTGRERRWRGDEGVGLHLRPAVATSSRSSLSLKRLISLASSVVRSSAATPSDKHFCQSIDKINT